MCASNPGSVSTASVSGNSNHKITVPAKSGFWSTSKLCLDKMRRMLKLIDSTTALIIRSSRRWSLAASIAVGFEDTKEFGEDDETIVGKFIVINLIRI